MKTCKELQVEVSGHDFNQQSQYCVFSLDTLTCPYAGTENA